MKSPIPVFTAFPSKNIALIGAGLLALVGSAPKLAAQASAASSQGAAHTHANASRQRPSDNPQFPAVAADAPMSPRAAARVQVNGRHFDLKPNKIGHLPRVHVEPNAEVPVTVVFDKGKEGEGVTVQVEDGGQLDTKTLEKFVKLDGNRRITFKYRLTEQPGSFRVVVRRGSEVKVFDFWVGPPLPVAPLEPAAQQ